MHQLTGKILVVDDEPLNVDVFAATFRKSSLEIRGVHSGSEALSCVEAWEPDLFVLDVMMPEMDGLELCDHLRCDERFTTTPVLMLTARSDNDDIVRGFEAGADDYVTKPFVRQVLVARVQALLRVKRNHDALVRSQRDMESFVATVSHDLKSPLASQIGLLDALSQDLGAPEAPEILARLTSNANYCLEFVKQLLELMCAQRPLAELRPATIRELLDYAYARLATDFERTGAKLEVEDEPLEILCDPNRFSQVFENLIHNAMKYVAEGVVPRVSVSWSEDGHSTTIRVADNGIGIEPTDQERIFDSFVRLHNRDAYSGTGIGLDIVKRIVEAHSGRVEVESEPGAGSTFVITLSKSRQPAADALTQ